MTMRYAMTPARSSYRSIDEPDVVSKTDLVAEVERPPVVEQEVLLRRTRADLAEHREAAQAILATADEQRRNADALVLDHRVRVVELIDGGERTPRLRRSPICASAKPAPTYGWKRRCSPGKPISATSSLRRFLRSTMRNPLSIGAVRIAQRERFAD